MSRQDQALERNLVNGSAIRIEVPRSIEVCAGMLRHQDHSALHAVLATAPRMQTCESLEWEECDGPARNVRHTTVERMTQVDDLVEKPPLVVLHQSPLLDLRLCPPRSPRTR